MLGTEKTRKAEELFNLGLFSYDKKDFFQAKEFFLKAYELCPDRESILNNIAACFNELEEFNELEIFLKKLIKLNINNILALKLLINFNLKFKKLEDILELIRYLKKIPKNLVQENFIEEFDKASLFFGLLGHYKKLLEFYDLYTFFYPKKLDIYLSSLFLLPGIVESWEEFNSSRLNFENNLDQISNLDLSNFEITHLPDNHTFFLSYGNQDNLNILKKYNKNIRKLYPRLNFNFNYKQNLNSKIKLGFISEFFTNHTVAKLFGNIPFHLNKEKFDIIIFHGPNTKDSFFKKKLDINFKTINLKPDFNEKIKTIEKENLDILFYTDIGMSLDLYFLSFTRLAQYQVLTWGHPETSGNPNIDFFISNNLSENKGSENFYSEKLIKFKSFNSFYIKPKYFDQKNKLNFETIGKVYFCPQSLIKILPDFDIIIKKILFEDKKANIFFIKDSFNYQYKIFLNRLKKNNIDVERIKFLDRLDENQFIFFCGLANVLLDPTHFSSGNSFIETFVNPAPLITFPGNFLRSNLSTGLYRQLGVENAPISSSVDEYVYLATKLANDEKENLSIRSQILNNSKNFFENHSVISEYESFFLDLMNKKIT